MSSFTFNPIPLNADAAADLPRVTYFILESHDDCYLCALGGASEYSIHIGLPDRPDRRHAWKYRSLKDALLALGELKKTHSSVPMWLSCEEILEEILGDDVVFGTVVARASVEPDDYDDPWRRLAAEVAWTAAKGEPVTADELMQEVLALT